MNRLVHNCSDRYLFSNTEKALGLILVEPKENINKYENVFQDWV